MKLHSLNSIALNSLTFVTLMVVSSLTSVARAANPGTVKVQGPVGFGSQEGIRGGEICAGAHRVAMVVEKALDEMLNAASKAESSQIASQTLIDLRNGCKARAAQLQDAQQSRRDEVTVQNQAYMNNTNCAKLTLDSSALLGKGSRVLVLDRAHRAGAYHSDMVRIQVIFNSINNSITATNGCVGDFSESFLQ